MTPKQIDTQLAALYRESLAQRARLAQTEDSVMYAAGLRKAHQTRTKYVWIDERDGRRVVQLDEALARVEQMLATTDEYFNPLARGATTEQARITVARLYETRERLAQVRDEMMVLNMSYTGWSRFFLVTSSKGHIHSSMCCSTCRPTTTYGWMPELSGKSEQHAVEELGPALCSVCYPTAPLEWTAGELTKAMALAKERAAAEDAGVAA